ncbi:MAG: hypothetical protein IKS09_06320 [Lachnospiraceae bacterium]|nr:hypothetical protein [Lachnospiraceae bacterium]
MITLLIIISMAIMFKILVFGLKAAWGIARLLLTLIVFPVIMVGLLMAGLIYLAIPILIVAGIIALISSSAAA